MTELEIIKEEYGILQQENNEFSDKYIKTVEEYTELVTQHAELSKKYTEIVNNYIEMNKALQHGAIFSFEIGDPIFVRIFEKVEGLNNNGARPNKVVLNFNQDTVKDWLQECKAILEPDQ